MLDPRLHATPPRELSAARALAHQALQAPSLGARANLSALEDDSHVNFGWDGALGALLTHGLPAPSGQLQLGVAFAPLALIVVRDGAVSATQPLDGLTPADAATWVDARLGEHALAPSASVAAPFELPSDAASVSRFDAAPAEAALGGLAAWLHLADDALRAFAAEHADITPGPRPVRCWPHHFDIATYVALEAGDPETARGVGVGLAPGDSAYDQPYVYINPWPQPAGAEPALPAPGRWHTDGFVGAVATGEDLLAAPTPFDLKNYLESGFAAVRALL